MPKTSSSDLSPRDSVHCLDLGLASRNRMSSGLLASFPSFSPVSTLVIEEVRTGGPASAGMFPMNFSGLESN